MAVKIAIAGTHSTGKSTLFENVARKFRDQGRKVTRVGDLAIEARAHGFPILREHTFASTLWIMTRGINLELEACITSDIVLVDRPVPDALGYLVAALKFRHQHLTPFETEYLEILSKRHALTYQCIFKTTIDQARPIDDKKVRDMDTIFRSQVDIELESIFSNLEIPFEHVSVDLAVGTEQIMRQAELSLKLRWTPKTGPQVKMDFRWSASEKKADYESKTQTA